MLLALPVQGVQLGEPPLVAGAPCGDAIAQPILLHRDLAAELVLLARLLLQHRVAPGLERLETLGKDPGDAAVEPDRGARDALDSRRSWLIKTIPERIPTNSRSSHSIPGRSRWLVGSSSNRISGEGASARARAARRASPPERAAGASSPERPSSLSRYSARW